MASAAAVVLVGLVTAIAYGLGRRILRVTGAVPATPAEDLAFSTGLGYGAIAYAVVGAGLLGLLTPGVLAGLLAVGASLGIREVRSAVTALRGLVGEAQRRRSSLTPVIGGLILVCAAANLLASLAPPTGGDALTYHLSVPQVWLDAHRVTEVPWRWPSYGPFTVQMLYMLGLALQGINSPSVFAWMLGLITAVALVGGAAQLPRPVPPLVAAGVFYTMSTVGQGSTSTRIDLGLALYVTLAALACLTYLRTRAVPWIVVAGVCAGLAAGTKYPGAAAAAVLAVGLVLFGRRWRAAGWFALAAAAVAAPWYVRSAVLTGDPAYPFFTALLTGGIHRDQLVDLATRYGPGKSAADLLMLPLYLTASLGTPYLGFAPFSLAWRRAVPVRFLWYVLAALAGIWFLTAQVIRFLLPALPAAALIAALGYAVIDERSRALRLAGRTALLAGLGAAAAITLFYDVRFAPVVLGWESQDVYLRREVENYADIDWMNEHLPPDARVLFFGRGGFYLDRPYVGAGSTTAFGDLTQWLAERRITHIYCLGPSCELVARSGIGVEVLRAGAAEAKPRTGGDRSYRPVVSRVLKVTSRWHP